MQAATPFFLELLDSINDQPLRFTSFQRCVHLLVIKLKLNVDWEAIPRVEQLSPENIHQFETHLKLMLLPTSVQALSTLTKSFCHLLIQVEGDNQFFMLHANSWRRHRVYDPASNTYLPLSVLFNYNIIKVWQAGPAGPAGAPVFSSVMSLCGWIMQTFKVELIFAFIFGSFIAALTLQTSMASGYIFSHMHEMNRRSSYIIFFCFLMAYLSSALCSYLNELRIKQLNVKLLVYTLPAIWLHIIRLPLKTLNRTVSGELSQKLFDYESALASMLSTILSITFSGMTLLCLFFYMIYCNSYLAFFYLLICVIFTAVKITWLPANMRHIHALLVEQSRLTQFVNEMLLQIHKIRTANIEGKVFSRWLKNLLMTKLHTEKSMQIELRMVVLESCLPLTLLFIFYGSLYFFPASSDTFKLLQFMICAGQFSAAFERVSTQLTRCIHFIPALKRLQPLLIESIEVYDPQKQTNIVLRGEIDLSNVTLRDSTSGNLILDNLSLHIPAGRLTAIIGRSGAGKSSLFRLLLGLESLDSGSIHFDQLPLSHFNISDLRQQFGVVLQTTNILPGTILSNLSTHADITHEEAWRLIHLVGLEADIHAMPMKLHTYISDNAGESISGGQKQKLLIARALASNPRILLLDEATSALDNHSQALIFRNLAELNITRVVIAHRYSTIANADLVYCLDQGRVTDSGTYAEVVKA